MNRTERIVAGVVLGTVAAIAVFGVVSAANDSSPSSTQDFAAAADGSPAFSADFSSPGDFYDRFDYGLSGQSPAGRDDPNAPGAGGVFPIHGDHDLSCGAPTTFRDVMLSGETWDNGNHFPNIDFSQMFWYCAPSGPASGHMMTGLDTTGYNHLWFSPKDEFTGITKVCWDINETTEGGKWTEVQFVDHADATRYPTGSHPSDSVVARGTGGFDLGYTDPGFRDPNGPSNSLFPQSGNLAGLKIDAGSIFSWWQDQDTMIVPVNNGFALGWPGINSVVNGGAPVTDKATRYKTCVENVGTSQLLITNNRPDGVFTYMVDGAHIPQDARRVVFHDSEYDGPKRGLYNPQAVTWHWDNIQVFTAAAPPPTTTVPTTTPSTTTPTTSPTTTAPTTTTATSTTLPTTSTTVGTTTTGPTTTVKPTTTTTTIPPIPACPSSFNASEKTWCQRVMQHIAALEAAP